MKYDEYEVGVARSIFKPGQRIELGETLEDAYPQGVKATITHVDDLGQVHVRCDGGGMLALMPGSDKFNLTEKRSNQNSVQAAPAPTEVEMTPQEPVPPQVGPTYTQPGCANMFQQPPTIHNQPPTTTPPVIQSNFQGAPQINQAVPSGQFDINEPEPEEPVPEQIFYLY